MAIRCGNCGGTHDSVAEVRRCHELPATTPADQPGPAPTEAPPAVGRRFTDPPAPTGDPEVRPTHAPAERWAGPDALGRSLVVRPGQPAPAPWADAPRVVVDDPPEPEILEALTRAFGSRSRLVIEVVAEPDADEIDDTAPWLLGPEFTFLGERTRHLILANSVDARAPDGATWAPAGLALALGARLDPDPATAGDVVVEGVGPVVCDGGPVDPSLTGDLPVLHRVGLEHGSLVPLGTDPPHADLAPDQLAAVAHVGGGARIIAPAGSGKTRVLTERARHLLTDRHLPASALTLVAFNVRAAQEMTERTTDLPSLHVRTLNSLALAICNGSGPFARPTSRRSPVTTLDERGARELLDGLVPRRRRVAMHDRLAPWLAALTEARLGLRPPWEVEAAFGGEVDGFGEVFPRYRAALDERGAVDFDEQVVRAVEILCTDPQARHVAQQACRVLLADEFQDLTPAHLLLLRLLAAPGYDLFGVGDDDQTIYGFSCASPDWLVDYPRYVPGAGSHALTVNYRCPPAVVTAATNLLGRNRHRLPKTVTAAPGRPATPGALLPITDAEPVTATVARVRELLDAGVAPAEVAVLTRVNVTLLGPQVALAAAGVPVRPAVGPSLLERTGVDAALAWLRLATATDGLSGRDIATTARRPSRGLRPMFVDWMADQSSLDGLERLAGRLNETRDQQKVQHYADDLRSIRTLAGGGASTAELLAFVRDDIGLGRALETLDASGHGASRSAHGDDLEALLDVAHLHPDAATFSRWLRSRLDGSNGDADGVHLATVHKVKGREWRHVVVHDVSAGLVPHRLAEDPEEERRIFHVALTRCHESVTLVARTERPSPYLAELTEAAPPPGPDEPEPTRRPRGAERARAERRAPTSATDEPAGDPDPAAEAALRAWRTERARADTVPPYLILHDRTLVAIATALPGTLEELSRIKGIGPSKLTDYGDEILATVEGTRS